MMYGTSLPARPPVFVSRTLLIRERRIYLGWDPYSPGFEGHAHVIDVGAPSSGM